MAGAYERATGAQVAFARADRIGPAASSAYLCDVFVPAPHRGRGLGEAVCRCLIEEGPGARFRWSLHTGDAHGLHRRLGFGPADHSYMERPYRPPGEAADREGVG